MRRLPLTRIASAAVMIGFSLAPLAASATASGTNHQLIVACKDTSSNPALCSYAADGTAKTVLVNTTGGANYSVYGVSAAGTKVLLGLATGAPSRELFLLVPQTGTLTDLGLAVNAASISSDGTKMAVSVVDTNTGDNSVKSMNIDKTSPTTLAAAVISHSYPSVVMSPDGTKVAYTDATFNSGTSTFTDSITTIPFGGGGATVQSGGLTNGGEVLDWSPDGTNLLVTDGVNTSSAGVPIATLLLSSGVASDIIVPSGAHIISSAVFSPDGTKVLYDDYNSGASTDTVDTTSVTGTGTTLLNGLTAGTTGSVLGWSAADLGVTVPATATGATDPTATPAPTLPKSGSATQELPVALLVVSLLGIGAIEVGRRRYGRR